MIRGYMGYTGYNRATRRKDPRMVVTLNPPTGTGRTDAAPADSETARRIARAKREVARLERAYPAAEAEWELAEAEWAAGLPGAGDVIDAARDEFDTLATDIWLARERLAGLVAEQRRPPECALMRGAGFDE